MSCTDKNRYDFEKIPVSEHTLKGMTLNSNDVQYIGRMLCLQDEANEETLREIMGEVIKEIQKRDVEITILKRYQSLPSTLIRMATSAAIALGLIYFFY